MKKHPNIYIKAVSRHHGLFITLSGLILLMVVVLLGSHYWLEAKFPLLFLLLVSMVAIFIGLLKLAEPKHSLILSKEALNFNHRHGQWQLLWKDIRNVFPVTNTQGIHRVELNYVGIRLKDLHVIYGNISLRLANRLIHEQKPLIQYCIKNHLISFEQGIINFEPYILPNGDVIKGPLAAFLHHTNTLFHALGAHLYIADTSLNSNINEFVHLVKNFDEQVHKESM